MTLAVSVSSVFATPPAWTTGRRASQHQQCVQVVGAVGWGNLQLDIPSTVEPAVASLIRRCWSEPAVRPSFSELISIIKDMAHARGLHPAVRLST